MQANKKELQKLKPTSSKKTWPLDSNDYKRVDKINNLVEAVIDLNKMIVKNPNNFYN
jgi:hypothetical protein